MALITVSIDGRAVTAKDGSSILQAAQNVGIYIPTLCFYPDLPPAAECKLCLVAIDGQDELVRACDTIAIDGMVIDTSSPAVQRQRRDNLALILAHHPHACLTCAQREGCSRTQCSNNVAVPERCCVKFDNCEVRKVADYIGIKPDTPRYIYDGFAIQAEDPLIRRDPNLCINCTRCIRACEDIRGVGAIATAAMGERQVVDVKNRTLIDSDCRFCTSCVAVCPTGAFLDKTISLARREAEIVPCRAQCPAGIDIPSYLRSIAAGKFAEAAAIIRQKVPFPAVLGAVCFRPCESVCRRGGINHPVAICSLKRFAAENDSGLWKQRSQIAAPTGKKVAIVGSGPGGLTAAYYLAKKGHRVTVFEALSEAGGMMRVGIPAYRLPRAILDQEIAEIARVGVEIRTSCAVGGDTALQTLKDEGFQAVLLAIGAHKPRKLNVPGESLRGVVDCVDLLRAVALGEPIQIGEKVIVIGGGNAAIDAARTALRLGAKDVCICYRRTREEMPASASEIEDTLGEGVRMEYLISPVRVLGADKVTGIEFLRMSSNTVNVDRGRKTEPVIGSEFTFAADTIVSAIGQEADTAPFDATALQTVAGAIATDEVTASTNLDGVFAAGDAVSAPGSVIEAIAAGRKAASAIDRYLGGDGEIDETLVDREDPDSLLGRVDRFGDLARVEMPCTSAKARAKSFARVELGYDSQMAMSEARRCLQCDLRLRIGKPILPPEMNMLEFNAENVAAISHNIEGVYQLLDENEAVLQIKGTASLRRDLEEQLKTNGRAKFFRWEEDRMYTKRESELISHFVQVHGRMPEGEDELDDLF